MLRTTPSDFVRTPLLKKGGEILGLINTAVFNWADINSNAAPKLNPTLVENL
jgi:hypothetical protein